MDGCSRITFSTLPHSYFQLETASSNFQQITRLKTLKLVLSFLKSFCFWNITVLVLWYFRSLLSCSNGCALIIHFFVFNWVQWHNNCYICFVGSPTGILTTASTTNTTAFTYTPKAFITTAPTNTTNTIKSTLVFIDVQLCLLVKTSVLLKWL